MNKHLSRFIFAGSLFVAVLSVGLLLKPGQASAAIVQSINGDVSIGCPSGCQAVTDNPTSYYQIESPNTGSPTTVRITVSYPCSSNMGFKLNALVGGGDPNAQYPSVCSSRNSGSVAIDFGMYTGANCKLDTNTGECYAIIYITAIGASSGHFAYRLNVNGSADIANDSNINPTSNPAGPDWPPGGTARQFGMFPQNPTFSFTTPCNMTKQFVYVAWSGVDYGSIHQPNNVSWQLTDNGAWVGSRSNGQLDGNDSSTSSVFSYGFWAYPDHTYRWSWSGIDQSDGGNEVVFSVPFTQNSFDLGQNCNPSTSWSLSGKSIASIPTVYPGGSVSFYHTVTNASSSSGNASYSWQVQASYGNGPGSYSSNGLPSGTTGGAVPPGASWPNPVGSTVTPWPTTATNFGAIYCQRIIYTNANGLNNPPNGQHTPDTPACVQLAKPTTPVLTCTSTYVPKPPPPSFVVPSGSGWSTDTSKYKVGYADITIAGTNASPANFQSGTTYSNESAATGATDHEPYTISYKPTGNTISITVTYYEYAARHTPASDGSTVYQLAQISSSTTNLTCYTATCTLSVSGALGRDGEIIAGQDIDVTGTITNPNDPSHPEKIALDPNLPNGNPLSLTFNGAQHHWGSPILVGDTSGSIDLGSIKANPGPNPSPQTITAYPDYWGTGPIGPACSITFAVYAPFILTPHAQVTLFNSTNNTKTIEDPNQVINNTWVTISGPKVSESTTSQLYEIPLGGGPVAKDQTSYPGPFDPAVNPTTCLYQGAAPNNVPGCNPPYDGKNFTYAPSALEAGDAYCAEMTIPNGIDPTDPTNVPYVGPSGDVLGGAQVTAKDCPVIKNRPYVKVYDSGVSTGGAFKAINPSCSGDGELAGWNNDTGTYPSPTSGDYGASAQLNALALGNIVGFASGQGNPNAGAPNYTPSAFGTSPTNLTFANTNAGNISGDSYSPSLGGAFDPGAGGYCLNDQTTSPTGDVTNATGPYTLNGGSQLGIANGDNKSIFVTGDVYIAKNVIYNTSGWSYAVGNSNIPSFVLRATGNIYISRNVAQLDGVYIAQGEIYTCSDDIDGHPFSAMPATELFNNCKNQLTVNGSFVASQVNLMRTFGSLRDETPNPGTPGTPGTPGASQNLVWSCGGSTCNPSLSGDSCVHINETAEPVSHTWDDNQLCVTGADSGSVSLAWTHGADTSFTPANDGGDHSIDSQSYLQSHGYPDCTNWGSVENAPYNYPASDTWSNNVLCSNVPVHFYAGSHAASPNELCTAVTEPSDTDGNNVWNSSTICVDKSTPGSPPGPSTPGITNPCDNGTFPVLRTCAAEVFNFSPELYLSSPNVAAPSNGAPQWDAITSLPPVL